MRSKGSKPRAEEIWTKVVGVAHRNGSFPFTPRQKIIRRYCRDGGALDIVPEPKNRYSSNALAVWVERKRFLRGAKWYQVGYIPEQDSADIVDKVRHGWSVEEAWIYSVVGGGEWGNYGLRINVELLEPWRPSEKKTAQTWEAATPPEPPKQKRSRSLKLPKLPGLPAPLARRLFTAARFLIVRMGPYLAAGWVLCAVFGRWTDLAGTAIVAAILAAGLWAAGRTFSHHSDSPFTIEGEASP